jgi:hypothetical protein
MTKKRNPLRSYLRNKKLSQADFVRLLYKRTANVFDRSAVSRWVSGDRVPDRYSRMVIEKATGGKVKAAVW